MVETLFMRFSSIYWHRWTSLLPTDTARMAAVSEWHDSLKKYSMDEISYALDACKKPGSNYKAFPPTLGEFVDLCEEHRRSKRIVGVELSDISLKASKEEAKKQMDKIKAILAKAN